MSAYTGIFLLMCVSCTFQLQVKAYHFHMAYVLRLGDSQPKPPQQLWTSTFQVSQSTINECNSWTLCLLVSFRRLSIYAVGFLPRFGLPSDCCHKAKWKAISCGGWETHWPVNLNLLALSFWETFQAKSLLYVLFER